MVEGRYCTEGLYHFNCGYADCRKWFSIGDADIDEVRGCPWCLREQKFIEIKNKRLEGKVEKDYDLRKT